MRKKVLSILLAIVLVAGVVIYLRQPSALMPVAGYCPFCDPVLIENQGFYEDDYVLGLCTHKPVAAGHVLIVSKRHVQHFDELTDEELVHMGRLIQKVHEATIGMMGASSYLLLQKNGRAAGQDVPHVHIHYVPKCEAGSTLLFMIKWYLESYKKPMSPEVLHRDAQKMKEAMCLLNPPQ